MDGRRRSKLTRVLRMEVTNLAMEDLAYERGSSGIADKCRQRHSLEAVAAALNESEDTGPPHAPVRTDRKHHGL
jgi:hypothetical protein